MRVHLGEGSVDMIGTKVRRGRTALIVVAVAVAGLLVALPTTAFASKATTKIVVASSLRVNHDTATTNLWPVGMSAKIQRKSGSHYVALKSASVKIYYWDVDAEKYVYFTTRKSSSSGSLGLSIPGPDKWKLSYAGSSSYKSSTAYTTVTETIGDTVSQPTIEFTPIAGTTKSWVNVTYDLSWNTAAWDGPLLLNYVAEFENVDSNDQVTAYADYVEFNREILVPGPVEFNYKVETSNILNTLWTRAGAWAAYPYFYTPSDVEHVEPTDR